ncbi:MAG: DUF2288 domain-containing protein [Gammaproteobacteria bacterium]|nr:DUF2288 domain-containing protein [Gammaproteobacteria bacterium]
MDALETKLNLETARVYWHELARYFAAGRVIRVAAELDLVDVAGTIAKDDTPRVKTWLTAGQIAPVTDDEAKAWQESGMVLWAVVVKPFVLVQPPSDDA